MRFLKFNSLSLLVQNWNDLTRWLVLYNSWIALISWWFGFFSPFLFNPLTWMCSCRDFLRVPIKWDLCANANISEALAASWKSAQVSKEPQVWASLSPHRANMQQLANGQDKGAFCSGCLVTSTSPSGPQEKGGSKNIFFQMTTIAMYWIFPVPSPVWNILHMLILFQFHIIFVK